MSDKVRYAWLDIARGICILLMVICHASGSSYNWLNRFNGVTGTFFLVFFFIAAGFCFNEKKTLTEYIKSQSKKCLIPYLAISVIYLCVCSYRHTIPGETISAMILNAGASLIWGLSNTFKIGPFQTIGMGPVWFLLAFFMSTVLYKLIGNRKYSGIVIIILAILASVSQSWIVLPFTIQDAFVGCMFIWFGNTVKKKWSPVITKLNEMNIIYLILLSMILIFITKISTEKGYALSLHVGRFLDLGSNNYSIVSLPASLFGSILVVVVSVIIDRTKILDEFFALCGKDSFRILILHDIDITMVRTWWGRDKTFIAFAILIYPFMVYVIRRAERAICLKNKNRAKSDNKAE